MIEPLKSAGDELRAAWGNYYQVCSNIQDHHGKPLGSMSTPELKQQLDIELAFISSLEPKIQEIAHTIRLDRDYAPIHSLSPEILIRIFHFVLAEPCGIQSLSFDNRPSRPSRYPEYLTQVCALWRRTALSSRSLWCHIDLTPFQPYCTRLAICAWTFIQRTGDLPIILHIGYHHKHHEKDLVYETYPNLSELIWSFGNRVKSFGISVPHDFRAFHHTVFRGLFPSSNLTELTVDSIGSHCVRFIVPRGVDTSQINEVYEIINLDIPHHWFENSLAHLKVLHLHETFLLWSSSAYRGLVDLRLESHKLGSERCRISEAELKRVLHSSPKLLILHFGIEIRNSSRAGQVTPVYLEDLSVLKLFRGCTGESYSYFERVLALLALGSKPLRLCLSGASENHAALGSNRELEKFLSRSRVTMFCSKHIFLPVRSLLRRAAQLEHVILFGFLSYDFEGPLSTHLQVNDLASFPRLKSLDVTSSVLSERELNWLLECCPTGITLCSSHLHYSRDKSSPATENRSEAFPTVKISDRILQKWEDPTDDWDTLE